MTANTTPVDPTPAGVGGPALRDPVLAGVGGAAPDGRAARPVEQVPGAGWPGLAWLRALTAGRPLLADGVFAAVLLVLFEVRSGGPREYVTDPLFTLLLCLPLVLRRRYPLTVFGVLCAVAFAQWLCPGFVLIADAALLVGLYTVAVHRPRRWALVAAAVLEAGVGLAVFHWWPPGRSLPLLVLLTGMVTAAFVLGVNLRTRRAYLASLEDRTLRAEHERDQQSQIAAAVERARIAREVHDIIAHNLSVMIALADGAAFAARTESPTAHSAARQVSATGRQALAEMHRLLGVLRDAAPRTSRAPQPGIAQLDDLLAQVRSAGLVASLTVTGQPFPLPGTA